MRFFRGLHIKSLFPAEFRVHGNIQRAEQMKVHTMLVIGNRDLEANAVSLRVHGKGNLGAKPRGDVVADILSSITQRSPNA